MDCIMSFSSALNSASSFVRIAVALLRASWFFAMSSSRVLISVVRRELFDGAHELGDARLRDPNRLALLLVVRLAPARELVVDVLVRLHLLLQLLTHVLQQVDDFGHRTLLLSLAEQGRARESYQQTNTAHRWVRFRHCTAPRAVKSGP